MVGAIGTFTVNGKQVGGFRGWTVFVETLEPVHSWVVAAGWWLFEKINCPVTATFFSEEGEGMEPLRVEEVILELPEHYILDKLLLFPLKMTFDRKFDWRHE